MKRRQKRALQMAFLFMAALIFLPNVGLWSLYRDKHLLKTHEAGEAGEQVSGRGRCRYPFSGLGWTDGLRRRDWHDNDSIRRDELRTGKGEQGKAFPLAEDECDDSVYKENGFNIYVSNNIALDRSLPDIRHPNCKQKLYLENLPNTSIIIPFHNEGWSSLLRTVHSVVNRTPDCLIAEIILVDDHSDRGRTLSFPPSWSFGVCVFVFIREVRWTHCTNSIGPFLLTSVCML
uniref:Polypeptide N-acetylgalactosaminyltransferase like 6 n=1 Tax=Electrophorus electricus TaxID=8005 RepID=A0A4W4GIF5_ELEEL